jgi:hypothetical protein
VTENKEHIENQETPQPVAVIVAMKKKWYKTWWKSLTGVLAIVGLIWGVFEGVYMFTAWHHQFEHDRYEISILKKKVNTIIENDLLKDEKIKKFSNYIVSKRKSYAVGFRVFNDKDEDTGIVTQKKMYRDWEGIWNEVYIDNKYSRDFGVDYYYYIDKKTGEKTYCW